MVNLGVNTDKFRLILRQRLFKDNPIIPEHVDIAEKIWGKDVCGLKAKTTRRQPKTVVEDIMEIPREIYDNHPDLVLEIDVAFINKLPMLTGIDTTVKYRNFEALQCRDITELRRALDTFLRTYNKAGFRIKRIDCDSEFKPLFEEMEDDWDIELNFASKGEHVPHVERHNRTFKERFRMIYHSLPFKRLPRLMIRKAGEVATNELNLLPVKGGVSKYYSPKAIMTSRSENYKDHEIGFGTAVQADEDEDSSINRSSPKERTIDCIYFQPAANRQDGHELMHIQTVELITRRKLTPVPTTQPIVDAVEKLAKRQGMQKSFKIESRVDIPIVPAHWICRSGPRPPQR